MMRTCCSACGFTDLELFLDLGASPIADAYTTTPMEPLPWYPLQLAVCGKCHLVQLLEVLPASQLFGTGYSFYSSASPPLSRYHERYADIAIGRYGELALRGVLEVGSNDGDLLRHFRDAHLPHLGVDPSTGPAAAAAERGCDVLVEAFSLEVARRIRDERGPQGVVIANHVLAHVEDVADCLAGIAHLMDDRSVALVEVQYLPDLLVNNAFDLVYHEHRNFFSLTSLEAAAARHGLVVVDAELTDRQGGSLRVTLARRPDAGRGSTAAEARVARLRRSETWLASRGTYEGMQGRAERIRERLLHLAGAAALGPVAAYGAPAKLTTLLAWTGLGALLNWCVDSTPAKQGRYLPGTSVPIVAPGTYSRHGQTYLLAAWNYTAPIMMANPGCRWIVPFPAPVELRS